MRSNKETGWTLMPTGAIRTPKNNNPDKKSEIYPDDSNPDFNATKTIPTTVIPTLIPTPTILTSCVNFGYF
jgi:hypothetical protein